MTAHPLAGDLDEVLDAAADDLRTIASGHLFVTGGTGFVGIWLLESLLWARRRLSLGGRVTVLSRDPEAFASSHPRLTADPALSFLRGDVRVFDLAGLPRPDAVVHAATTASAALSEESPDEMLGVIVDGHRRVLAELERFGRIPVLFTSSGAVYGRQPPELSHVDETFMGGPDPLDPRFAYHEGKRAAEMLSAIATHTGRLDVKIARLFAFVGPHLPLDRHFAIGNFIRDALAGGPIVIGGDGSPFRSYQYASDMAAWCWAVLARGQAGRAYNVGSEEVVDIRGAAATVTAVSGDHIDVEVRQQSVAGRLPERYVPSTLRARTELGVVACVPLAEGVRRTLAYHRSRTISRG